MTQRLLHIIPTLDRAGAEKQLCLLVEPLRRRGWDVHVCALTRGGPRLADLQRAGVPVEVIGKRSRLDPQAFWRLKKHVARLRPDLVHTWLFAADAYGRVAARMCRTKRTVAGLRCADPWKGWPELAIDRWLARYTDQFVANSPGVRDFYVSKGLPAAKIEVIPNAVRAAPRPTVTRNQLLEELRLPGEARLIGLVARFWPQKRIKDAIWAADLLKTVRGDAFLLIFGDGPQRDRLWKFRDQVEIRDKVFFLGERPDVQRFLPHVDVFWSTSGYEGQSNAVLEAMAAGVPVVATDIPGTRDLVVDGETGYLFPVGVRADLARHTQRLLNDRLLVERLGKAGKQRARNHFSVESMVQKYTDLYEHLLGQCPAAGGGRS